MRGALDMNTSMNQASLVLLMSSRDPGKRDAAARALHGSTIDASAAASLVLLMSSPDPGKRDAPPPTRCKAARSMHRLPRRWSC